MFNANIMSHNISYVACRPRLATIGCCRQLSTAVGRCQGMQRAAARAAKPGHVWIHHSSRRLGMSANSTPPSRGFRLKKVAVIARGYNDVEGTNVVGARCTRPRRGQRIQTRRRQHRLPRTVPMVWRGCCGCGRFCRRVLRPARQGAFARLGGARSPGTGGSGRRCHAAGAYPLDARKRLSGPDAGGSGLLTEVA